ncbi:MAG: sugar ABC transporter substrate-binding protein [Solirubrobacteraceae bacterium]
MRIPAIAGVCLSTIALAACGSSSSSSTSSSGSPSASTGKLKSVGVAMYARDNPFFTEVVSGIQYEAKRKGINLDITWAENDPTQEVTNIQNLITRQPDGLIVSPIDPNALIPPIQRAKGANIPVVLVTDDLAKSGQQFQLTSMSSDYTNTGRIKAQFIANALHGSGQVGVIHLIRGLAFTQEQWTGAKQVFARYPNIKIAGEIYAGGAASTNGLNAAENLLTAHPGITAFYVDNDPLALGVIQAVQQSHVGHLIVIVGADGTPSAIAELKKHTLALTIDFCGFNEGVRAIDALYDFKTRRTVDTVKPPQIELTPANIAKQSGALPHGCDGPG